MDVTRCPACGDTRWHLLPVVRTTDCPSCGEPVEPERRTPGRRLAVAEERRDAKDTAPLSAA